MPSIPQSLLWISLVVLWLFVLVPMLISKRDAVRRTSDVALATRVLNGGVASRLLKRAGPAAGHRSDPHWTPEDAPEDELAEADEDRYDGEAGREDDEAGDRQAAGSVVMQVAADDAPTEPDYLDVDVVEDSGALPAGAGAEMAEPGVDVVETEADADQDDRYEYVEDSSGLEPAEDDDEDEDSPEFVAPGRSRRRRFDTKTAAAVSARKYTFRKRVLMVMAVFLVGSATRRFRSVADRLVGVRQRHRHDPALPGLSAPADPDRGEGASSPDAADGARAARRRERLRPRIRPGPVAAAEAGCGGPGDRR